MTMTHTTLVCIKTCRSEAANVHILKKTTA
jgi:hypothetical protein